MVSEAPTPRPPDIQVFFKNREAKSTDVFFSLKKKTTKKLNTRNPDRGFRSQRGLSQAWSLGTGLGRAGGDPSCPCSTAPHTSKVEPCIA